MASVNWFAARECWRIAYSIYLDGRRIKKAKYLKIKTEAKRLAEQLEVIEQKAKNGLAGKQEIEAWIEKGWLTPAEAGKLFEGYKEVIEQRRQAVATDYGMLLEAFKGFWLEKTDREVIQKNLGSDMSHARHILFWLEERCGELHTLNMEMVQQYLLELKEQGIAENTIKNRLNIFRQLIDRAVVLDMAHDNPARQVNLKQVNVRLRGSAQERRILANGEVPILLEASLRHRHLISGGLPVVVRLGLYAGLRNQEMCWLAWDAVDWQNRIITVRETTCKATGETWKPKDYESRRLDVKESVIGLLQEEKERQETEKIAGQFVLPGGNAKQPQYRNRPLQQDAPQKAFAKMILAEGLDPAITIYSLRHTYATMLLRSPPHGAGLDIRTVQNNMGHSDIKTTMTYLHHIEPEQHPTDKLPY